MKVVIVGNGVAGFSVAMELRAREPDRSKLELLLVSGESYYYYSRIRLPEVLSTGASEALDTTRMSAEHLALRKPSWYSQRDIDIALGQEVVGIDRASHRVIFSSGTELGYDKLVLALGSQPAKPSLPGVFLPGVFTLREFDDAVRIRAWTIVHPGPIIVLGGGLLGLEAARHLADGHSGGITVVEAAPRLLPRQLDAGGASLLASILDGMGLGIVVGGRAAAFEGTDLVEALVLEEGRKLDAGTVLLSMGVRPRIGLAKTAGLATGKGILVDAYLRTSDPAIFAVGDCAEAAGCCLGIIPAALDQAPVCAAALLGDESRPYEGTIPSNTLKVAGVDLSSAGLIDPPVGAEEVRLEPGPGRYERYILAEGKLAGAIVFGDKIRARAAVALMGKAATRAAIESLPEGGPEARRSIRGG
jgi:nitrite reductase (NADH) large subunit